MFYMHRVIIVIDIHFVNIYYFPPCTGQSQAEPNVSCPSASQKIENHDLFFLVSIFCLCLQRGEGLKRRIGEDDKGRRRRRRRRRRKIKSKEERIIHTKIFIYINAVLN